MEPFPEATGREETTEEESERATDPDAGTDAAAETGDDGAGHTGTDEHVCDPDSPVPCQFH